MYFVGAAEYGVEANGDPLIVNLAQVCAIGAHTFNKKARLIFSTTDGKTTTWEFPSQRELEHAWSVLSRVLSRLNRLATHGPELVYEEVSPYTNCDKKA